MEIAAWMPEAFSSAASRQRRPARPPNISAMMTSVGFISVLNDQNVKADDMIVRPEALPTKVSTTVPYISAKVM